MIRRLTIFLVIAALGLSAGDAAALFETNQVSTRARAMGGTGVASPGAAWAPFLNPAALGTADGGEVAATYQRPFRLDFHDFVAVGACLPFETKYGRFGVGLTNYSVSWQDVTLEKETRFTFAHGVDLYHDMHSQVSVGWSANVYRVEFAQSYGDGSEGTGLDPGNDATVGLDLGLQITLHRRTKLALQAVNMNNPIIGVDNEELTQHVIGGVSYEPYDGVTTAFEVDNVPGEDVVYKGGLETRVAPQFALRAGVATNPNRLTAGFGYTMRGFSLDYGFSTGGGTLDSTHQFGLVYAWGGEAK